MNSPDAITLAIESAISGGSISLLRGDLELGKWTGSSGVSRAEDLLADIDVLLTSKTIDRHTIGLIAVSAGPGSFTGIRIGVATALGLKGGLGATLSSASALSAMVHVTDINGQISAAVPIGRNALCLQAFDKTATVTVPLDQPHTLSEEGFCTLVGASTSTFILHPDIYEMVRPAPNIVNFGTNIAYAVGRMCRDQPGLMTEPLFISKSF
jgi:tRNA threonylcarbamoyl adenosine modification protein YeaZ